MKMKISGILLDLGIWWVVMCIKLKGSDTLDENVIDRKIDTD